MIHGSLENYFMENQQHDFQSGSAPEGSDLNEP